MQNPYEVSGRLRKAAAIADIVERLGLDPQETARMTRLERGLAAAVAGQNIASDATWQVVVEEITRRRRHEALIRGGVA